MEKAKQIPKRLASNKTAIIYLVLVFMVSCVIYYLILNHPQWSLVETMATVWPFNTFSTVANTFIVTTLFWVPIMTPLSIGLYNLGREKQPTASITSAIETLNATVLGMNTTLGTLQTSSEEMRRHATDEKTREEKIIEGQNNLSGYVEAIPRILNHLSEIKKQLGAATALKPEAEAKVE